MRTAGVGERHFEDSFTPSIALRYQPRPDDTV